MPASKDLSALAGLHILLAEDNPTNQMVAVQMLRSLGAEVTLAVDGAEALELAAQAPFDLALIDIEMPRVSGTDVIRRIRAGGPPGSEMPLIALTAYVMREHRIAIDEAGADGVIAKPILSIEQLGRDILALVQKRRSAPPRPAAPPEPQPAPPQLAVMDEAVFNGLEASIGAAAMRGLLRQVQEDMGVVRERLRYGIANRQPVALREASHVLVAVAGSIGAARLHDAARCLNSAAHSGNTERMEREGGRVLAEIDPVLAFVRARAQG